MPSALVARRFRILQSDVRRAPRSPHSVTISINLFLRRFPGRSHPPETRGIALLFIHCVNCPPGIPWSAETGFDAGFARKAKVHRLFNVIKAKTGLTMSKYRSRSLNTTLHNVYPRTDRPILVCERGDRCGTPPRAPNRNNQRPCARNLQRHILNSPRIPRNPIRRAPNRESSLRTPAAKIAISR